MRLSVFTLLRFLGGHVSLLLGAGMVVVGLLVLVLGDWRDLYYYVSPVASVTGQVVAAQPTNYSVEDYPVRAITFRYQPAASLPARLGHCYSLDTALQPGQAVAVKYCTRQPGLARVADGTIAPYGCWGFFTCLLLVLMGGLATARDGRRVGRQLVVLRDAALTEATFRRSEAIQPRNDESENYLLYYAYQAGGQHYPYVLETSNPDRYGGREPLAYQRANPANAVLLTMLPAYIRQHLETSAP